MYKKCEEILGKLENERKIRRLNYQFPEKQPLAIKLKDFVRR